MTSNLYHQPIGIQHSWDLHHPSSPPMDKKRLSVTGSIKSFLSRKSSTKSTSSHTSMGSARGRSPSNPTNPFDSPVENTSRSPLANRSEPTRRPRQSPPPPSYSEATSAAAIPAGPSPAPRRQRDISPSPSGASAVTVASVSTPDDPYAFLKTFDTIFLIDDSGSMAGSSWRQVATVLANIAPICTAHDSDGVDVFFLNHKSSDPGDAAQGKAAGGYNITDEEQVNSLFNRVRPTAATPTGTRIHNILKPYLRHYEQKVRECGDSDGTDVKPINMIVITDGVPTDDLEGILVQAAKKLDKLEAPPYQIGIQFFQVGNEDGAARHLRELDDNLGGRSHDGLRDMIDTVSWDARDGTRHALTADAILKTVLGAVIKRLDRRGVENIQEQSNSRQFLSAF